MLPAHHGKAKDRQDNKLSNLKDFTHFQTKSSQLKALYVRFTHIQIKVWSSLKELNVSFSTDSVTNDVNKVQRRDAFALKFTVLIH